MPGNSRVECSKVSYPMHGNTNPDEIEVESGDKITVAFASYPGERPKETLTGEVTADHGHAVDMVPEDGSDDYWDAYLTEETDRVRVYKDSRVVKIYHPDRGTERYAQLGQRAEVTVHEDETVETDGGNKVETWRDLAEDLGKGERVEYSYRTPEEGETVMGEATVCKSNAGGMRLLPDHERYLLVVKTGWRVTRVHTDGGAARSRSVVGEEGTVVRMDETREVSYEQRGGWTHVDEAEVLTDGGYEGATDEDVEAALEEAGL